MPIVFMFYESDLATKRHKSQFWLLCGPLRISAISALTDYFNAEDAEIRRGRRGELQSSPVPFCGRASVCYIAFADERFAHHSSDAGRIVLFRWGRVAAHAVSGVADVEIDTPEFHDHQFTSTDLSTFRLRRKSAASACDRSFMPGIVYTTSYQRAVSLRLNVHSITSRLSPVAFPSDRAPPFISSRLNRQL
jgi:hypothetical protein